MSEGTFVTTQFQALGVMFDGPKVLTAGSELNELEFPPFTAANVVLSFPSGAGIQANSLGAYWSSVSGRITGTTAVTLTVFGDNPSVPLASVSTSAANFSSNANGLLPNILLELKVPNIAYVQFSAPGGDFTLDDFAFTSVPEPSSLWLFCLGEIALNWTVGRSSRGKSAT